MYKLADISAFERLQGTTNTHKISSMSVFNGVSPYVSIPQDVIDAIKGWDGQSDLSAAGKSLCLAAIDGLGMYWSVDDGGDVWDTLVDAVGAEGNEQLQKACSKVFEAAMDLDGEEEVSGSGMSERDFDRHILYD